MDEYISREDVLDIVSQYCLDDDGSCSKADVDPREMLDEIEALPSADVQPVRHGRWIISSDGYYPYCSECQARPEGKPTKFCGECGARMDGGSDE